MTQHNRAKTVIVEGHPIQGGYQVEFQFKRTPARIRLWSEPTDVWGGTELDNIMAPTVRFPFAYDVRKTSTRFYAEVLGTQHNEVKT